MAVTFLTTDDKAELERKIEEAASTGGSYELNDEDIAKIVDVVIAEIPAAEGSGF